MFSIANCIAQCMNCTYLVLNCIYLENAVPSEVNKANCKKGIQFPSKFPYKDLFTPIFGTGGSRLSHTVVKPDSHLAWIFGAKFLFIIKLIIVIG